MTLHDDQRAIEQRAYDNSLTRQTRALSRAANNHATADLRPGRYLAGSFHAAMVQPVDNFINRPASRGRFLKVSTTLKACGLSADVVSHIAAKAIINTLALSDRPVRRISLYHAVGDALHDQWRVDKFQTVSERRALVRKLCRDFDRRNYSRSKRKETIKSYFAAEMVNWQGWTRAEKVQIGRALVELFQRHTGMLEFSGKRDEFIGASPALVSKIANVLSRDAKSWILKPPMVVDPVPWNKGNLFKGGYQTDALAYPLIKRAKTSDVARLMALPDEPIDAVNAIQATPFRINRQMLEAVEWSFRTFDKQVGKLPGSSDLELPRLDDWRATDEESKKMHLLRRYEIREENRQSRSKRLAVNMALSVAREYQGYERVYFPVQLDTRGRLYAVPSFLNPQGSEYVRSLIEFADGLPVETHEQLNWLAINGANAYGQDKISLHARYEWVIENEEMILSVADNYREDHRWMRADEPFSFLRFCFEWQRYKTEGLGFTSHFICSVDATCSGLQHYAAMTRDEDLGRAVNLVKSALRQDVYGDVAVATTIRLVKDRNAGMKPAFKIKGEMIEAAPDALLKLGIDRALTKKTVMTTAYNSRFYSALTFVREAVAEKLKSGILPTWNRADAGIDSATLTYLAQQIWLSVEACLGRAKQAMRWLSAVALAHAKAENEQGRVDEPLSWTTPDGFVVRYLHKKQKRTLIHTVFDGHLIDLVSYKDDRLIDPRKMSSTFPPNFIHSMDATHLRMSVNRAVRNGITSFAVVHDSFGSHVASMPDFVTQIKSAFVQLYKSDVMADLQAAYQHLEIKVPIPMKGNLNLSEMVDNEYCFS